jgi:hypothetical protein
VGGEIRRMVSSKIRLVGLVVELDTTQGNLGFGVHESVTAVGRTGRLQSAL